MDRLSDAVAWEAWRDNRAQVAGLRHYLDTAKHIEGAGAKTEAAARG